MMKAMRFVPVLGVVLGLSLAGGVSAKSAAKARSYEVQVSSTTKVGTQVLKPGDYKVKLDGSNAVFTKENTKESVSAPATIVTGEEKFGSTVLHEVQDAGQSRVTSIELEGTKDLLKLQ